MNKLTGIVICGGQSSRMGSDKSLIVYHDLPQRYHMAALLQAHCDQVYLSLNTEQAEAGTQYPVLTDQAPYQAIGPMAALLTAFAQLPGRDLLVTGCDYPLLDNPTLSAFVRSLEPGIPSAFYNAAAALYEPLLAYYPVSLYPVLLEAFETGNYSLQQCLRKASAKPFPPADPAVLFSADDPQAAAWVREQLRQRKNTDNGDNRGN